MDLSVKRVIHKGNEKDRHTRKLGINSFGRPMKYGTQLHSSRFFRIPRGAGRECAKQRTAKIDANDFPARGAREYLFQNLGQSGAKLPGADRPQVFQWGWNRFRNYAITQIESAA